MAKNNPFNREYDLGIDKNIGLDRDGVNDSILDMAYTHSPACYVCTVSSPQYQVLAKDDKHNTAQIQNGLYICFHCTRQGILDAEKYALRDLQ